MENATDNMYVRVIGKLSGWAGALGGVFLFIIVIAILCDFSVMMLYTLPLRYSADLLSFLGIYMILLPAAMALRNDRQVQVNLLFDRFPPKVQRIVTLASLLIALVVFTITAYNGYLLTMEAFSGKLKSNTPFGMKLWYSQSAVVVGITLLCLQIIAKMVAEISTLGRRNK